MIDTKNILTVPRITDAMKRITQQYNVPGYIDLTTRTGHHEIRLVLVGSITPTDLKVLDTGRNEFNYRFFAEYSFRAFFSNEVVAIDFSEGPLLRLGDTIPGTELEIVEFDISNNLIVTTKK